MNSTSIKLPLSVYNEMSERGQLNPTYVRDFIEDYYYRGLIDGTLVVHEIKEPTAHYYFRLHENLHSQLQQFAKRCKIPMNELIGRLFDKYYKELVQCH